jgi:hypothetical protein
MQALTRPRPRNIEGSHIATITRIEELAMSRARITFELETVPPVAVRRNYPLSLHPRSALSALLTGLEISHEDSVDLAQLVGVRARVQVARKVVATKNTVVSATRA